MSSFLGKKKKKDFQLPTRPPTPDVVTRATLVLDCLIQPVSLDTCHILSHLYIRSPSIDFLFKNRYTLHLVVTSLCLHVS